MHILIALEEPCRILSHFANAVFKMNSTYFSALGEDESKLLLARAVQMFMPGKPQVWYLDLFAGTNNYETVCLLGNRNAKPDTRVKLSVDTEELQRVKNGEKI